MDATTTLRRTLEHLSERRESECPVCGEKFEGETLDELLTKMDEHRKAQPGHQTPEH